MLWLTTPIEKGRWRPLVVSDTKIQQHRPDISPSLYPLTQ